MSRSDAVVEWEARSRQRAGDSRQAPLPAPTGLRAVDGAGIVTLTWKAVAGAAGYLVKRGPGEEGPFAAIDHQGGDVFAVPDPVYGETTGIRDAPYWYAVAAVTAADAEEGPLSKPVLGIAQGRGTGQVAIEVDASASLGSLPRPWHMVGSEHLSQLDYGRDAHGFDVGAEVLDALRLAHTELGAEWVRAHGILLDELGVYREVGGQPRHDFSGVNRVYDRVLAAGLRPVVELGFMPRDLASDPDFTVFEYKAIASPPKDWDRWRDLVAALAANLVERYGIEEVARWGFEVWNEPNLQVFWSGSTSDYFRLYDEAARAVKSVDARLLVGGPATAAAGWIPAFSAHVAEAGVACDFISTHTYGNLPLDVGPAVRAAGLGDLPAWWTEWGVSPRHFAEVNDLPFAAPFVLSSMASALDRVEHLAYWVISDHFEELGKPPRLFHGGFGLLTVGNLRKPRYWALRLLELLGAERLPTTIAGDGAGSLVGALATRDPAGEVQILAWNGTLDQSKRHGDALLTREVAVSVAGLGAARYRCEHVRVDNDHSNILAAWERLGKPDWPDASGWEELRKADRLEELEPARTLDAKGGRISLRFELPMPGCPDCS